MRSYYNIRKQTIHHGFVLYSTRFFSDALSLAQMFEKLPDVDYVSIYDTETGKEIYLSRPPRNSATIFRLG